MPALQRHRDCARAPAPRARWRRSDPTTPAAYRNRLFDLSIFIKELKGRFAQWYNRRHGRYGVLWAERFKSVLLESGEALAAVAAYIELNPVRAGLCADPKDYRYCGYAEALAKGSSLARQGIRVVLGHHMQSPGKKFSRQYRNYLFVHGSLNTKTRQPAFDLATAQSVVDQQNGELSLPERLPRLMSARVFRSAGTSGKLITSE